MKKHNLFLLLTWVFVVNALGQSTNVKYIYVKSRLSSVLPSCQNCITTSESSLNTIFSSHGVTEYQEAFPGATTPLLVGLYRIVAPGDLGQLKQDLTNSNLFDVVELVQKNIEVLGRHSTTYPPGCSSPQAINDPDLVWAGNNHLLMSDAYCAWTLTHGDCNTPHSLYQKSELLS